MTRSVAEMRAELPEDELLPRNTRRSLPIALLRARESVSAPFRPLLMKRNVTEQQWRVIRVLAEESPLDASEVAARACVLAPSLTRIIKALEERGFVTRKRDSTDRRKTLLALEPAGCDLIRDIAPEAGVLYQRLVLQYGKERIETLLDMLNDLAAIKL